MTGRVFRLAHYAADGELIRATEAYPPDDPSNPQVIADLCARAADTGCGDHIDGRSKTGTFLVWLDRDVHPPKRLEDAPAPDGRRSYGGEHPPVPAYRWVKNPDSSISLTPIAAETEGTHR